ncbi:hypothetical protein FAUST_11050 [Fusarium austroamericanum]|uniref:Uncharacterized protein n=1 Tax=Fusarium austroamericanum TaxID=282268 RepID=A0AAN5Z032_FUSAU|nr:hypothetical protein FAUST_11050 [Fusarium austroamericanum]
MSSDLIVTITNNLGYDVDVFNVFNPDSNAAPGTPVALTYTKLATVPNGTIAQQVQAVQNGSSLQAMVTGNIETLNGNYYQQFPAVIMDVSIFATTLDFTLSSDMLQSMVDSFQLIKYMQANPTSALARGFRKALAQTSPSDAINTFFQSTGSFQQCTYSTWNAVFTWQTQFTSAWQGTYYLYSVGSSSTDSTAVSSASTLVATLAITASPEDSSAVLTMAADGGQSTPVAMPGDGSMREQNVGTSSLSVSLNPVWLNVPQANRKTGVSYTVIGAAFMGTINNVNVAGNMNQLVIPSISNTSPSNPDIMSPIRCYSDKLCYLVGILTEVMKVSIMFKDSKAAERQMILDAQKEAKDEADAKAKELEIQEHSNGKFQSQLRQVRFPIEVQASHATSAYDEVATAQSVQRDMASVANEGDQLNQILSDGSMNMDIEKAAMNIEQAEENLVRAENSGTSVTDAQAELKDVGKIIADTSEKLKSKVQSENNTASQDEKTAEQGVEKVDEEVQEEAKETEEVEETQKAEASSEASDKVDSNDFGNETPQN